MKEGDIGAGERDGYRGQKEMGIEVKKRGV